MTLRLSLTARSAKWRRSMNLTRPLRSRRASVPQRRLLESRAEVAALKDKVAGLTARLAAAESKAAELEASRAAADRSQARRIPELQVELGTMRADLQQGQCNQV